MQQQTVIPQLRITNASRSLAFYVDGLGFAVDWKHQFEPGDPLFFQLTRAGQTIFITNSLPYAYRLEYDGWSRQAPAGMVRVTVVEFAQRFERAVRAAKGAR